MSFEIKNLYKNIPIDEKIDIMKNTPKNFNNEDLLSSPKILKTISDSILTKNTMMVWDSVPHYPVSYQKRSCRTASKVQSQPYTKTSQCLD